MLHSLSVAVLAIVVAIIEREGATQTIKTRHERFVNLRYTHRQSATFKATVSARSFLRCRLTRCSGVHTVPSPLQALSLNSSPAAPSSSSSSSPPPPSIVQRKRLHAVYQQAGVQEGWLQMGERRGRQVQDVHCICSSKGTDRRKASCGAHFFNRSIYSCPNGNTYTSTICPDRKTCSDPYRIAYALNCCTACCTDSGWKLSRRRNVSMEATED